MQLFPNVELEYMSRRIWYTPVFWGGILIYLLHPVCVNPPAPWKKKEWIQDPDLLVYLIFIIASMLFLSYNELNLLQEGFRMLKNAG